VEKTLNITTSLNAAINNTTSLNAALNITTCLNVALNNTTSLNAALNITTCLNRIVLLSVDYCNGRSIIINLQRFKSTSMMGAE
jgi:hypothetical protein